MTFGIKGGFEAGKQFYDALKLVKRLVNLGDAKSLACHPASTTHRQMSVEEQRKAGVTPEMIRLSIGIEHADDIIADLEQALQAAAGRQKESLSAGSPRRFSRGGECRRFEPPPRPSIARDPRPPPRCFPRAKTASAGAISLHASC